MSIRGVSRPLKHVYLWFFNHVLHFLEVWQGARPCWIIPSLWEVHLDGWKNSVDYTVFLFFNSSFLQWEQGFQAL
jgi:hypothetical protein